MRKLINLTLLALLFVACTNDCPDGLCDTEVCPFCPDVAVLIYPKNNQACEPGLIISETTATVILEWEHAKDADAYQVTITNQYNGKTQKFSNLITNTQEVILERGQAYSWSVTSFNQRANITKISTIYQFYLQGKEGGIVNYAPFAPTLLTPESGEIIDAIKVYFSWRATDLDGDDLTYKLYVDSVDGKQTPPSIQQNLLQTYLTIDLDSGKDYYFRVEASDGKNTSSSITRSFSTK